MDKIIRVGSRESRLAIAQTEEILTEVRRYHPEMRFELVTMKTTGDRILDRNLDQIGGKGLFVKELDKALLEGRVDLTIHSLKDLPMEQEDGLPLIGYSKRKDPRDAMILSEKTGGEKLSCIGSSSRRRILQVKNSILRQNFGESEEMYRPDSESWQKRTMMQLSWRWPDLPDWGWKIWQIGSFR